MRTVTKFISTATLAMTISLFFGIITNVANAGSLENLERERAFLVQNFLDPGLAVGERSIKIDASKPRLVDLERMVLRDQSLTGRNTPTIRKAFANYDLTFLVHASAEKSRALVDVWLEQIGVTTKEVMATVKVRN